MRYALLLLLLVGCGGGTETPSNAILGTYEIRMAGGVDPNQLLYGKRYTAEIWKTDIIERRISTGRVLGGNELSFWGSKNDGESSFFVTKPGDYQGRLVAQVKATNGEFVQVADLAWSAKPGPLFKCEVTLTYKGAPRKGADIIFLFDSVAASAATDLTGKASHDCPVFAEAIRIPSFGFAQARINGVATPLPGHNQMHEIPLPQQTEGSLVTFNVEYLD